MCGLTTSLVLCRKRKREKASVSLREFFDIVEKLLPDEDELHAELREMRHPPESLSGAVSKFTETDRKSIDSFRRKLLDHAEVLVKAARRLDIKKGRWWQAEGDSKGNARKGAGRKRDTVNHVDESPLEKQVRELTGAMAQLGAGQEKMQQ